MISEFQEISGGPRIILDADVLGFLAEAIKSNYKKKKSEELFHSIFEITTEQI